MTPGKSPTRISVLNPVPQRPTLPFVQELQIISRGEVIASARWHAPVGEDGVIQLIDIHVQEPHRRYGLGSALIRSVYAQAAAFFTRLGAKPRRIWVTVEQKKQVNARAFFSRHGFHHVSTIKNLHRKQDTLIYLRAFD